MKITRFWEMPSHETFSIKPIGDMVRRHLRDSKISIDPFSRDNKWTTYTNDLNPETAAAFHLDALDFLNELKTRQVEADLIIFDPPYSLRQAKECYDKFGTKKFTQENSQNVGHWAKEKRVMNDILLPGGFFIHCGWNSNGMGKKYNMEIIEILLIAHGGGHNDTIVTVERKKAHQRKMF